jgi:hypothetical protein
MAFKSYEEWKMEKELKEQFGPKEEVQVEEEIEREIEEIPEHIEISEDVKIPEKIGDMSTPPPESFGMDDDFLKEVEATLKGIDTPKSVPIPESLMTPECEPEPIKSEPVPAGLPPEYYEIMGVAAPEVRVEIPVEAQCEPIVPNEIPELPPQYVAWMESVTPPPIPSQTCQGDWDKVPPEISLEEPIEIIIDTTNIPDEIEIELDDSHIKIGPPLGAWDTEEFHPAGHTEIPMIDWTEANWKKIKGIGPKLAKKLVENGPYKGIARLEGLVSKPVFKRIRSWVG